MRRFLFVLIVFTFGAGTAVAQHEHTVAIKRGGRSPSTSLRPGGTAPSAATGDVRDATIQALLDRMEHLEKRIAQLEARQGTDAGEKLAAVSGPSAGALTAGTDGEFKAGSSEVAVPRASAQEGMAHPGMTQGAAPPQEMTYPSLKISGYADVNFSATDEKNVTSGFNLGQFVLHMASPLSKKVSYFGEISLTATASGYNVELERTIIRYDWNDYFKLSFGRYHTPVSYWNTAFHHGSWLQTTISRPEMIKFGGRLLPVHFVGFQAEGNIPSGGAGLGYSVGVGNGRGSIISRAGDAGDVNNNRAWLVNFYSRPSALYGLQVGATVYRDKITPGPGLRFNEWISSAYLAWTRETPEILAEFSNTHHSDVNTSRVFNTQAFYVQLAYRLPFSDKNWKPYYRFEYINRPSTEPVLGITSWLSSTAGLRWDISNFAALKGEYRNFQRGPSQPHISGVFLQTSFTF
jgi:hypothetical protein